MKNVVIIGNGPAGISAALYTKRAGFNTTIIGKDSGAHPFPFTSTAKNSNAWYRNSGIRKETCD